MKSLPIHYGPDPTHGHPIHICKVYSDFINLYLVKEEYIFFQLSTTNVSGLLLIM